MDSIKRIWVFLTAAAYFLKIHVLYDLRRKYATRFLAPPKNFDDTETVNVVIIGASFAGYNAARLLTPSLPPGYRLIVIEPHSHFHFTWVFPRFCVVEGHEKKAFIPYGPYLPEHDPAAVEWVRGRAVALKRESVTVRVTRLDEEANGVAEKEIRTIPYQYLVIATGSVSNDRSKLELSGLPSRIEEEGREAGAKIMVDIQERIKASQKVVIIGGGAAGVELASDAASHYNITEDPRRKIVLVHSRDALMHRFGKRLQDAALQGLEKLGVEVILGDRVVGEAEDGQVTLRSGRKLECDFLVYCTGQKPASALLQAFAPTCITESGLIKVRPTLQVDDKTLSHVYACGDVADTHDQTPNGRSAMAQAGVVADNIVQAAWGKSPRYEYKSHWADGLIKLTLGLNDSVTHIGNEQAELLFVSEDKDPTLHVDGAWLGLGVKPFQGL